MPTRQLRTGVHVAAVLLALFLLANAVLALLLFDLPGLNGEGDGWRRPFAVASIALGLSAGAVLSLVVRARGAWSGLVPVAAVIAGAGAACVALGPL